jgi:hypothetical protein
VTAAYQGWFSAGEPNPPEGVAWEHWSNNNQIPSPSANNLAMATWPDMRPYQTLLGDAPMQYQTGYGPLGNGLPATLFTSYNKDVVDIHMKWLGQYGIHTVAIGRFNPTGQTSATITAENVLATAPKYGVKFFISYDVTGWTNYPTELPDDWTNVIIGQLQMTSSSSYARQNGKPVVEVWIANQTATSQQAINLINWLHAQGLYVILGTGREWLNDPAEWLQVYNTADMIQPWMVAVIGTPADSDNFVATWKADLAYTTAHGIDFQVDILPGSDSAVPPQRLHGDFMWEQFANAVATGVKSVFVTMYDEFGEGNQIMPTAEDASMLPSGVTAALDSDGTHCSADYYMRLTGDGARMLAGQIPLTYTRPTQPVVPVRKLVPGTIVSFQAMANGDDVTADQTGSSPLIASSTAIGPLEQFQVVDAGNGNIALQSVASNFYVTAENAGASSLIANRTAVGLWETFTEVPEADGNTALLAQINGKYVTAENQGQSPLIANRTSVGSWETFIVTVH